MYTRDTLVLLKHFLDSGLSKTAIADQLGISRRLVHHLIATGQLDRDLGEDASPRTRAVTGVAKLATVTPLIETRLAMFPAVSAVRLFAACRAAGYTGGYSQLTALVRRLRPPPAPEAVVRFETAPGAQAQFDFATGRQHRSTSGPATMRRPSGPHGWRGEETPWGSGTRSAFGTCQGGSARPRPPRHYGTPKGRALSRLRRPPRRPLP